MAGIVSGGSAGRVAPRLPLRGWFPFREGFPASLRAVAPGLVFGVAPVFGFRWYELRSCKYRLTGLQGVKNRFPG